AGRGGRCLPAPEAGAAGSRTAATSLRARTGRARRPGPCERPVAIARAIRACQPRHAGRDGATVRRDLLPERDDLLRPRRAAARGRGARAASPAGRLALHLPCGEPQRAAARVAMGGAGHLPAKGCMRATCDDAEAAIPVPAAGGCRRVVGIGEFAIAHGGTDVLVTHALGSCVAVCIYDPEADVAGMLHVLLPDSRISPQRASEQPAAFADTGVPL